MAFTSLLLLLALLPLLSSAQDVELPPTIAPFSNVKRNFVTLDPLDPLTLDCAAKGEPEPQITWFKDGEELTVSLQVTWGIGEYLITLNLLKLNSRDTLVNHYEHCSMPV